VAGDFTPNLMRRKKGLWQIEETVQLYKNGWLEVCEDKVIRPDDQAGSFATVRMKPGVSVLAMDEAQQVYLTANFAMRLSGRASRRSAAVLRRTNCL
jgi:hypothetical protein